MISTFYIENKVKIAVYLIQRKFSKEMQKHIKTNYKYTKVKSKHAISMTNL